MASIYLVIGLGAFILLCWAVSKNNGNRGRTRHSDMVKEIKSLRHVVAEQAMERFESAER